MPSEELKRKLRRYCIDLIASNVKTNKLPATIIGAEHGRIKKVDRSGKVPDPLANNLTNKLQTIATIGTKANGNYVGCCCEVRSSNQIMQTSSAPIPLRNIQFTNAIRPRTNQIISRCHNCQIIFG